MRKDCLITLISLTWSACALAQSALPEIPAGMPYDEAKRLLQQQGWKAIPNLYIQQSSLYAQSLYQAGNTEVVDCISMELDGCNFRYGMKKTIIEVSTITKQLLVDKVNVIKK